MLFEESFTAHGHNNIRATHNSTIEVTKESDLSTRGECIVAVSAEKGLRDLNKEMKMAARCPNAIISLSLRVGGCIFISTGRGHADLTWEHPTDIVTRMSSYICPRTLLVHANKADMHMSRSLIQLLKEPQTKITLTLTVEKP
jgi:hypothetical protein